ncbi:hypothetical protein T492DRAFT_981338 [Pavlovales sp. CCMP2436]|nr:hypothetical protein T492DRAFT_981338 [Pavlovales sp. CCMP2436]|mmetsp:Transcript_20851/g.52897  ORF Transcript_20851/g.52897 Transcript_20851/m.52897 type:complete len:321 (-) Transcript_20851:100-1062(-)
MLASLLFTCAAVALAALTPVLCAGLYLSAQLVARRLPPPKLTPGQTDVDFPGAVISLLLWYLIACVAVSVHAELGWIAACFAVAACFSLPFVNDGNGSNSGSALSLFSLDALDDPLSILFLYGMLPLLCILPLVLAGKGAFVHCFLWGHLCWDSARYGSLPNAVATSLAIALVVNSFDGFSHFDDAPLLRTLIALPAGKALFRLFWMNKSGFFAGVLLASLVSQSVRVLLATTAGISLSLAVSAAAFAAAFARQAYGLPGVLTAAVGSLGGAAAASTVGSSPLTGSPLAGAATDVRASATTGPLQVPHDAWGLPIPAYPR